MEESDIVEEKKFDILGNLPFEVAHEVFLRLTPQDIANSLQCCKKWQEQMNHEYIWKLLNRRFYNDLDDEKPDSENYRKKFRSYSLYWQGRYMYSHFVESIVKNEALRIIPVKANKFMRYDCLHFDDSTLILGLIRDYFDRDDFNLLVINSSTGLVKSNFSFFYESVIKHGNLLIAISNDFHLKIWNIENGKCIVNVKKGGDKSDRSWELLACEHLILIKARRKKKPKCKNLYTFNMETKEFACLVDDWTDVCCTDDRIAIVKYTGSIEIVDSNINFKLNFMSSKTSKIYKTMMNDDFFAKWYSTEEEDTIVTIWNIKAMRKFKIPLQDIAVEDIVLTPKKTVICIQYTMGLEIWDMRKQICLFEIFREQTRLDDFKCFLTDRYIFLSYCSNKQKIQIWCLRTGKFVKDYQYALNPRADLKAVTNSKLLYSTIEDPMRIKCLWQICDCYDYKSEVEPL